MEQSTIKTQVTNLYVESENKTIVRLVAQCEQLGIVDERIIGWYHGEPSDTLTEQTLLKFLNYDSGL